MTELQARTLEAAIERILPSDDGAGARESRVIDYVRWLIDTDQFRSQYACFALGVELLEDLAVRMNGAHFAACSAEDRDAVMALAFDAPHPTVLRFLVMLVRMTLTGFLCAPVHGGNHNETGWTYIGFKPHPFTSGRLPTHG